MSDSETRPRRIVLKSGTPFASFEKALRAASRKNDVWDLFIGDDKYREGTSDKEIKSAKQKALGILEEHLDDENAALIQSHPNNPKAAFQALKEHHVGKDAGGQFAAIHSLMNIKLENNEPRSNIIGKAANAMRAVNAVVAPTLAIKIENASTSETSLQKEFDRFLRNLEVSAILNALLQDERSSASATALLVQKDITVAGLQSALRTMDLTDSISGQDLALKSSARYRPKPKHTSSAPSSSSPYPSNQQNKYCSLHESDSHALKDCKVVQSLIREWKQKKKSTGGKGENARQAVEEEEMSDSETPQAHFSLAAFKASPSTSPSASLCADSGCTVTMCKDQKWFSNYRPLRTRIGLAGGKPIYSMGIGSIAFEPSGTSNCIEFRNVLHVPDLHSNLLSLLSLVDDYTINISSTGITFHYENELRFSASISPNGLAYLDGRLVPKSEQANAVVTFDLLHRRLCHTSSEVTRRLVSGQMAADLNVRKSPSFDCPSCCVGKMHKTAFPKVAAHKAASPGHISSDLKGPLRKSRTNGAYSCPYIDEFSHFVRMYHLKTKSQQVEAFTHFLSWFNNQTNFSVKRMRDDGGGEYKSNAYLNLLASKGIHHQVTPRAAPELNGQAERFHRTWENKLTAMLFESGLPNSIWEEASNCFVEAYNRTPFSGSSKTPYELLYGAKPSVDHLRVFGCEAYVHVLKDDRRSFQPKAIPCVFLGYQEGTKAWRFFNTETKKLSLVETLSSMRMSFLTRSKRQFHSCRLHNQSTSVSMTLRKKMSTSTRQHQMSLKINQKLMTSSVHLSLLCLP